MATSRFLLAISLLLASVTAVASPSITHWSLPNGARVYFVRSTALPMVQVEVVFDAGSARDPAGKYGLACFANTMLDEGAGKWDADEIASRLDRIGAELDSGCGRDMATLGLRSLSSRKILKPALDVFGQLLAAPTFPNESLTRERERVLVALQRDAQSASATVSKAFYRTLYGDHPYAHHPRGDKSGLNAITREDLESYRKRYYVGANAVLAIVGDLSVSQAKAVARQLIGTLPRGQKPAPIPPVADLDKPRRHGIEFPSTQTHIRVGQPAMRRDDPDYFALYVGNYILGGGGMISRLFEEVREKRGLAYSTYSYFFPMRRKGPFTVGLQTENSQRDKALELVQQTLMRFIESGPTGEELQAAKKHLTGGFPLRVDSNGKIVNYLAIIGFYQLPLTYLDDFIPKIEAVTVEQIRDAFRRRVNPQKLATVILGGQS
ncbi:MAG: M16 family metallopeptidase [Acidiferrobacterales bacterium]